MPPSASSRWRSRRPRGGRLRRLGLVAVAAVVMQGVLGGLRVVLLEDGLAIVHGALAQAFFALVVALALLTSPRMTAAPAPADRGLRALAVAGAALAYLQIVFGTLLTHAGRLDLHLAGAVAVFALLPVLTARARRTGDPVAAPAARLLLALLGAQLLLGAGAYLARFSAIWIPGGQATVLALPVTHRLVGALIFGATVVLALRFTLAAAAPARAAAARRGARAGQSPVHVAGQLP